MIGLIFTAARSVARLRRALKRRLRQGNLIFAQRMSSLRASFQVGTEHNEKMAVYRLRVDL